MIAERRTQNAVLALIPARGGSKGLPGKNICPFAGVPLIAHSILLAKMCPEITRIVVSTDDSKIAAVAREYGAEVPFMRPAVLAQDKTPMWPVIQHALQWMEKEEKEPYEYCLLLDPTSPGRFPQDITESFKKLQREPVANGIVGVSEPDFSPIWHTVVEQDGWMVNFTPQGSKYHRRQDVPAVYRINASLYIWRADFIRRCEGNWREVGKHLLYEIPESRAIHIDTAYEFRKAELIVKSGLVELPWLTNYSDDANSKNKKERGVH